MKKQSDIRRQYLYDDELRLLREIRTEKSRVSENFGSNGGKIKWYL